MEGCLSSVSSFSHGPTLERRLCTYLWLFGSIHKIGHHRSRHDARQCGQEEGHPPPHRLLASLLAKKKLMLMCGTTTSPNWVTGSTRSSWSQEWRNRQRHIGRHMRDLFPYSAWFGEKMIEDTAVASLFLVHLHLAVSSRTKCRSNNILDRPSPDGEQRVLTIPYRRIFFFSSYSRLEHCDTFFAWRGN
ncbi:hypothetical protein BD324DRAFT_128458 [Kockovaella imperatae]|uniref:Uncharacterized protein n=1 Tax=Kockovaella imperatae TaxID=4999 RepID=A0A1Y1U9K6_9TREE|nr:hypothetical protein BD324DRAFT_128458 [Kockovaella imperatae]ORX34711.1 hypothetical protein BD324DRAFT_128458 [Kockovaella imperatae]